MFVQILTNKNDQADLVLNQMCEVRLGLADFFYSITKKFNCTEVVGEYLTSLPSLKAGAI